jgi:hypothetical protein
MPEVKFSGKSSSGNSSVLILSFFNNSISAIAVDAMRVIWLVEPNVEGHHR